MKKRTLIKIASVVMACTMCLGTVTTAGFTAYAQTSGTSESAKEAAMKTALTKVKKRVTIPAQISEFTYRVQNKISTDCFTFTWSTPKSAKIREEINISIAGDTIINYNYGKYDNTEKGGQSFAKLTDEELLSKAKEHLKKLNPHAYAGGVYSISGINLFGENATVSFQRKVNGIAVDSNGASVILNKDTGKLIAMNMEWWEDAEFASTAAMLSAEEAIASFKKNCNLTPAYTISYDYENDKHTARLVYRAEYDSEMDAFTGKKSTIWSDMANDKGISYFPFGGYGAYDYITEDEVAVEEAGAADGGVNFTEAELKEIEADKSLLKKNDITEMLQDDKYVNLNDDAVLKNSYLYKDEKTEEYFYTLVYETDSSKSYYRANVYLNAKTGEIENFYISDNKSLSNTKAYPVEENLTIAKDVMKYFYGDICGSYKSDPENSRPSDYYTNKNGTKVYETARSYIFNRYVNDVIVEGDTIRVEIDNKGNVSSVNYNYTDVKFPSAPELDKDKAIDSLFKQQPMKLYYDGYYKRDGSVKTYLIYRTDSFTLNRNYKLCYHNGESIKTTSAETDTNYTDIKGNKYEKAITTLARYGITLDSADRKFNPDGALTDLEFSALVYKAMKNYVPYTIRNASDDVKPLTLTKALAAKAFVEAQGGGEYAQLKGIFTSPYKDVSAKHEYVGYIAIAKAMGFIDPSVKNYNPDSKVTRGEAMQIIYDYILRLS